MEKLIKNIDEVKMLLIESELMTEIAQKYVLSPTNGSFIESIGFLDYLDVKSESINSIKLIEDTIEEILVEIGNICNYFEDEIYDEINYSHITFDYSTITSHNHLSKNIDLVIEKLTNNNNILYNKIQKKIIKQNDLINEFYHLTAPFYSEISEVEDDAGNIPITYEIEFENYYKKEILEILNLFIKSYDLKSSELLRLNNFSKNVINMYS